MYEILKTLSKPNMSLLMIMKLYYQALKGVILLWGN